MSVIHVLSPRVADMIAAGEVVERPGSVVKELMENSVDAGAKNITVEIRGGGATSIRVTDDGCGMAADDAGNCFLRHATSKLEDERGLEAIKTLGFRGEALAAISAVSRVTLMTRREHDEAGTCVLVAGGEILEARAAGCPQGTDFTVRDLFYNTPARLKFMKSDRAEGANCAAVALRVALGRPDVSVRCVRDGKEEFFTAGDGRAAGTVYSLLGRELAKSMLEVNCQGEGVKVSGFVSSPAAGRGNRAMQFFFVNGRTFRSATVQAALEQAYKNTLLTGRYPACALYLELSPGAVDVNVHPTKQEVKFSEEGRVFDAVYHGVLAALEKETGTAEIPLSRGTEKKLNFEGNNGQNRIARTPETQKEPDAGQRRTLYSVEQPRFDMRSPMVPYGAHDRRPNASSAPIVPTKKPRMEIVPELRPKPKHEDFRVVGEVLKTYIVVEWGNEMLLIDKHAAHERVIFDRLKKQGREVMAQGLLLPQTWRPEAEEREVLVKNRSLLSELGFELEPYGEEEFVVRALPADMDPADSVSALEEICASLKKGVSDLARDEVLQTIACKAAIKAGKNSDPKELYTLAAKVVSGEVKYCPHGRPVSVALTKKELDKQFKRIV
jgi:DNA mismatch repair protein MutL